MVNNRWFLRSLVLAGAIGVWRLASPFLALAAIGLVVLLDRRRRRGPALRLAEARQAALPFTIDLVAAVLGSGGTPTDVVVAMSIHGPPSVRPAFAAALRRSASGMILTDALAPVSTELGADYHPLIGTLILTEQGGAPVGVMLQRLGDDAEQARRRETEARLKKLPVALLLPLLVCLLPAVIIGAIVPLVIVALRQLNL